MAALVAQTITDLGGQAEVVPTKGWSVVYGELNAGAPRTLLLYGMYDVQPVTGEDWMVPPFGGEVVSLDGLGPCMVSRGVINQKGPLAGMFNAVESTLAVAGRLPVNVKFMIEGEEELGSRNLPAFVHGHQKRLQADGVYFPSYGQDRHGKMRLWLGVKGILAFELVCRGGDWGGPTSRGIHGSHGAYIASPLWRMIHALSTLVDKDERVLIERFYDHVLPPTREDEELLGSLAQTFDPGLVLQENDAKRFKYDLTGAPLLRRYLFDPIINIDGITSGYAGTAIKTLLPHEARAKLHVRLVPNMEPEEVREKLIAHLKRVGCADFEVHIEEGYPWAKMRPSAPLIQAMVRTIRSFGLTPEIWPNIAGSAPFYLFSRVLHQPFVMGGLGHGARQHSSNEYATIEGMRRFEESVVRFIYEFAAIEPE
jgi:acetylornithine deacetylase/succinyl-diaminopimelate desuccinylase-like protein